MTKFKLNIAEMICQAISLTLLFLPGMYNWEHWEEIYGGYGDWLSSRTPFSFFDVAGNTYIVLGIIIIVLMLANLIFALLAILAPIRFKNGKIYSILPFITIVLMVVFSVICGIKDNWGYCAPISWLFYIEMLFLIATAVIALMKCSSKVKEEPLKVKVVSASNIGNADELKKYKELLDSGVITQEEFDAKKKQLLGL